MYCIHCICDCAVIFSNTICVLQQPQEETYRAWQVQMKPSSVNPLTRGTCKKRKDRLFAQLPITAACLICNYIFTQQRGVAAKNSAHLFMKSSRLKSAVPPGRCLHCCQQHSAHIISIYPDIIAVALQLPSTVPYTHTCLILINYIIPLYAL